MERLTVESVVSHGNSLVIDFHCEGNLKKFLLGNTFFAQYSVPIVDVPEKFLIIPFLSTACPVAWANHADIYVNTIDKPYLDSLKQVQLVLRKTFPKIGFSGNIYAKKIVEETDKPRSKSMVLFSGGVDSIATYIRHRGETPLLVTIQGADIQLADFGRWQQVTRELCHFAGENGLNYRTVRSNFYDIIDHIMGTTFHSSLYNETWWIAVMNGLSFLGLCAPLTYVDEVGKLYIAASLTKDYGKPIALTPKVDDEVKWTGTTCSHDGYELGRQQKINLIADYAKKENRSFIIRACGNRRIKLKRTEASNCSNSKCEKCSRTILGLEVAGLDPNDFGFKVSDEFFLEMKANIKNHIWSFNDTVKFVWNDLLKNSKSQRHFPHPQAGEFIDWLHKIDLETVTSTTLKNLTNSLVLKAAPEFRYFPNRLWKINRTILRRIRR
ncbi:MAG: hypothetical protein QG670_1873 [Thermoproteota archaeon]|nr:hypothetical protein [Thermoproteota archaeon]